MGETGVFQPWGLPMPIGTMIFAPLMDFLPLRTFRRRVARYPLSCPNKTFSHLDHYLCIAFAQLTFRESLRDIEVCRGAAHETKLYHRSIICSGFAGGTSFDGWGRASSEF